MTNPPLKISVKSDDVHQRMDHYLTLQLPEYTRSHIQQLITKGHIKVNNQLVKSGYKLKMDDQIIIHFPEPEPSHILPENIAINIVFEDEWLVVVDKPAGLIVHPGAGHRSGTLVNALLYHCTSLSGINGILRPGIVHRLDKNTSGLMVVAKNDQSHLALARQFETREITRTYHAVVWGELHPQSGEINTQIGRSYRDRKKMSVRTHHGKPAVTRYHVVKSMNYFSLVSLTLGTGRTHQIRVHLNHISHPVFGDPDYNGRISQLGRIPSNRHNYVQNVLKKTQRQMLHAKELSFVHPGDGKTRKFSSSLPNDMSEVIELLHKV